MKNMKNKVGYLIILCLVLSFTIQVININLVKNPNELSNVRGLNISADVTHSKEWIKNGDFSSQDNWTIAKGELGDPTDVDASISNSEANYQVLGFSDRFTFEENYDMGASWVETNHPSFPDDPTFVNIVAGEGFRAEHSWDDTIANQVPSVQWEQNFSLPVNMSDYIITFASVSAGLNATVDSNIDTVADGVAGNSARTGGYNVDTYSVGDYIRFYVSISNLQKTKIYEIAYTQSATLGDGGAGSTDNLAQQFMSTLSQADLIYYLSSVLETDYRNFTLIVGIRFNCEDNVATNFDYDDFNRAVINSINLTFDYEKKIDQLTSISWNQVGDKPSDISSNPIVISAAILNFQYKINDTWPSVSPNSEFRILINDIQHSETVKLSEGITMFKDAKTGGFDVTSLIDKNKNVNLSLQVYLADQIELDRTINISIDNVCLNITYTEDVPDILTNMQLFLNSENKTANPVISLPLGENLNVTIKYTNQTGDHILGADVQLEGKVNVPLSENFALQQYSAIINTSLLGIGVKILTVKAQKEIYESQNIQFFVEVSERETELQLFLNSNPKNDGDTISVDIDGSINVTVFFRDFITGNPLKNATVYLVGGVNLNETNNYYNTTIYASELGLGLNSFNIYAQLVNYTPKSIKFFVEVFERSTDVQLFLNNKDKTLDPIFNITIGEPLNITIKYLDNQTGFHITNAIVQLLAGSLQENLTESISLQQYSFNLDTNQLGLGITVLNIIAQKDFYESQNIQIFIEVKVRETELQLFLNGVPKSDSDTIQVEIDDLINITVYFKDNVTKNYLSGATISLLGIGSLNETGQHYNITLSANDLDQGISILTIFAQLENYQPQSIQFFVEVVERSTELQLFLNGEDMTDDPVFDLPIGTILNITLKFDDNQTGLHINGATLQFIGESLLVNLTENLILEQYYLILNTADLKIGVNLFTVVAQANNFQIRTIDLRITVNRIRTIISTTSEESYINALPGGSIRLKIRLNNTDFGGLIKNATVTYRWAYGQGELLDIDNDGIYEVELKNIPAGTYTIIISASAGDYYDFESYEITLNAVAVSGPNFTILLLTLSGAFVALVVGFTLYQVHFKYPPIVRKSRKIRKKIRKGKKTKPVKNIASREDLIKDHLESNLETIQLEKKTEKGLKEK